MSIAEEFGNRALCSAVLWWEQLRPIGYTLAQHLAAPDVNCNGHRERELATDIAKYIAAAGREQDAQP